MDWIGLDWIGLDWVTTFLLINHSSTVDAVSCKLWFMNF